MTRRLILVVVAWLTMIGPARAQEASPELRTRAEQVVTLLKGEGDPSEMFTPDFLAQVPPAQLRSISGQLAAQHGPPRGLGRIEPRTAAAGVIHVEMERAILRMNIAIEPQPPHRIAGLLVVGVDVRGDTLEAVLGEIRALPGLTAVAISRLGDGPPELVASHEPGRALAIGSTFKLFILAELSRQVQAGERRWSDVASLDRRSLPSGMMQDWPQGSPVTLHTLASLMISISDNSATDMLLHLLGRESVERMIANIGVEAAARNRPFLGTLELFALKSAPDADHRAWTAADEAGRRRLLSERYGQVRADAIDPALFGGMPVRIDTVEWYASPADLVRAMDWFRRHGDDTVRAIMAISPGGPTLRETFAYAGYKGGSEPGVINLSWLVRNRAGTWYAVSGSWNNSAATLEDSRFVGLMGRALQLLR